MQVSISPLLEYLDQTTLSPFLSHNFHLLLPSSLSIVCRKMFRGLILQNFGFLYSPLPKTLFYFLIAALAFTKGVIGFISAGVIGGCAVLNLYFLLRYPQYGRIRSEVMEVSRRVNRKGRGWRATIIGGLLRLNSANKGRTSLTLPPPSLTQAEDKEVERVARSVTRVAAVSEVLTQPQ